MLLMLKIAFILLIPLCNGGVDNCQDYHAVMFDNSLRANEYLLMTGDFKECILVDIDMRKTFKVVRTPFTIKPNIIAYKFKKTEITKFSGATK